MTIICKSCGVENDESSSTCSACGSALSPLAAQAPEPKQRLGAKIMHPRREKPKKQRQYFAVGRPLAIAAAVLGIFSFLMPWVISASPPEGTLYTLGHYLMSSGNYDSYDGTLALVAGMILLGSVLTFVSSVGSFASLAGVLIFALDMRTRFQYVQLGFPIAVVACLLGIASLVFRRPFRIWDRLLVFVPAREKRGLSLDVLTLCAAVAAILAIVLPWLVTKENYGSVSYTRVFSLASFIGAGFMGSLNLWVASAIFIMGAIACLFTKLGVPALVVGAVWGFLELKSMLVDVHPGGYWYFARSTEFGSGFYFGILAAALGLVSLVLAYRVALPEWFSVWSSGRGEDGAGSVPEPAAKTGERASISGWQMIVSNWKKLAAIALIVGVVVAGVGFSYLLPLSKIEVRVSNNSKEAIAQATIYVDGREVKSGFASPDEYLAVVVSTTAGVHTVSIDYGWRGPNQSAPDGVPDWYSDVVAKPLQRSFLQVPIGFQGEMQPVLKVAAEPIPHGEKVTVESITWYVLNSPVPATMQWGDMTVILTDGSTSVKWQPTTVGLVNASGGIARLSLDERNLGSLIVLCNFTDLIGNGYANTGDFLTVTAEGGSDFSPTKTYSLYIIDRSTSSLLSEIDFQGA